MNSWLIKEMRRYRADQVNSPQKLTLLWRNLAEALGVQEETPVRVEIQDNLFDPGAVTVTFAGYVQRRAA